MANEARVGGRAGNIAKNSLTGLTNNVLPSLLRFFTRYVFIQYFGDTLLGVNSLFADVITIFSFAEIGLNIAISFFLYKPIAEKDTEQIQSYLGLFRKLNRIVILAVTVVGLAFIPFLGLIKTTEPIPGLLVYYLIFLAQNIISYMFSYRFAYLAASQKAYELVRIDVTVAIATEVLQILVTVLTRSFVAYLLTYVALMTARILLGNRIITKRYPETVFRDAKPLSRDKIRQFVRKIASLLLLKVTELGVSQTDSIIVSTMVDVKQWGYVSNYMVIRKLTALVFSSLASGLVPSLGNLSVQENREKQENTFKLYNFANSWLSLNLFAGLAILVSPFIALVFGATRVLDDLTCFLLFFNVLYTGLLEPVAVLLNALGQYERDKWINIASFVCNIVTSVVFVLLWGLPGVFLGTICSTTVTYYRIYNVLHHTFGGNCLEYYGKAAKTLLLGIVVYAVLHWLISPAIWGAQPNLLGLILLGLVTLLVTNVVFWLFNRKDACWRRTLQLIKRFLPKRKEKA